MVNPKFNKSDYKFVIGMIDEIIEPDEEAGDFENLADYYVLRLKCEGKTKKEAEKWINEQALELEDEEDKKWFLKNAKKELDKW